MYNLGLCVCVFSNENILIQSKNIQGRKCRSKHLNSLRLWRIANYHYVHDGVGEAGYNTFELIPAVVTLSLAQMFK